MDRALPPPDRPRATHCGVVLTGRGALWRVGGWVAAATMAFCLLTAGGSMTTTDAVVAFNVTQNMVERGEVATTGDLLGKDAYRGRGGRFYSPFGIAQSIWNIPFYVAGRAVQRFGLHLGRGDTLPKAAVTLGTVPAVGLLAALAFATLIAMGTTPIRAVDVSFLLVFATPLWPYSKFGFNQPLVAMFLWGAVACAIAGARGGARPWLAVSGLLTGAALLTRHEMFLALPLIGTYVAFADARARRVAIFLAGFLPAFAAWCAYNWWRFGSAFDTGYLHDPTPRYGSPVLSGTAGLLFNPYASLFLYSPIVLLAPAAFAAMWRRHRAEAALLAALFASFFLLYASLGNWMGGRSYGPRYLVPLLPALVLPLAFWAPRRRHLATMVIVLSVLVQVPGVLVDYSKVRVELARAGVTVAEDSRWSRAPLLLNAAAVTRNVPPAVVDLARGTRHVAVAPGSDLNEGLSFSPDLWWNYMFYLGAFSRAGALGTATVLLLGGIMAVRRARSLATTLSTPAE